MWVKRSFRFTEVRTTDSNHYAWHRQQTATFIQRLRQDDNIFRTSYRPFYHIKSTPKQNKTKTKQSDTWKERNSEKWMLWSYKARHETWTQPPSATETNSPYPNHLFSHRCLTVRWYSHATQSSKLPTFVSDPLAAKIEGSFRFFMYSGHMSMHNTRHYRAYEYTATSNLKNVEDDSSLRSPQCSMRTLDTLHDAWHSLL
jgi:hypothetical protein